MTSRRLRTIVVTAAVLTGLALLPTAPPGVAQTPSSFTFGAAGDMGAGKAAAATLTNLGGAGNDFFLHLGDFSYGEKVTGANASPASWCKFVQSTANLPANYPYELLSGGHASQ